MIDTLRLSESAVAVLRFRTKGRKFPVRDRNRAAFEELVAAGIMEPDGDDYRFTVEGMGWREEILAEQEDRIERERFEPPDDSGLSDEVRALFRRIVCGEQIEIDTGNRPAFRELAAARIVTLGHSFARGSESVYRFTYWGWHRRFELAGLSPVSEPSAATPSPSPAGFPAPGR